MAFSVNDSDDGINAEPNVVPLVDVMLVLLIIFMVTTPLMSHKVKVTLPEATIVENPKVITQPITIAITAAGDIFWNDELVSRELLETRLAIEAQKVPQPQVDVRADANTKYALISPVAQQVRRAGMRKIGFVSSPEK